MESLPPDGYLIHVEMAAFIPIAAVAGIGILMALVFIAFNIKYREYKLLKMTSPNLNLVMLSGSILFCIAVVLFGSSAWLPNSPKPKMVEVVWKINHAGIWLSSVAFTLFFAPFAAKTWRVHRIFSHAAVKGRVIKDDRLLCFVALLVIFDLGYLALWFGIDPPKCHVIPRSQLSGFFSPTDAATDIRSDKTKPTLPTSMTSLEHGFRCTSQFTPLWIVILFLYKGVLLYYIIYVAWATRYVRLPSMKDSGGLIISIFVALTSFCIATPLVTSLQRWPNAQYIVMSSAIFLPLFTVMLLHFIPKLILIRRHSKDEVLTRSFSQHTTPKQPGFSDAEIRDIAIQNASLRKEVAEKQRRYKAVLEQLRITKAKLFELSMLTTDESTAMNTCATDDAMRSGCTESTRDVSTSDVKRVKRKENLARELAHKVTRALILKSAQGVLKSDDVSISVTSLSTSQQGKDDIKATETKDIPSTKATKTLENEENESIKIQQNDPDVKHREYISENESSKKLRHVSFNNVRMRKVSGDQSEPASHLLNTNPAGPVIPKPVLPVLGRNSWDYYTRGTGYLRYHATVLNQGENGTNAAITGYPVPEPTKNIPGDNTQVLTKKSGPFQTTQKFNEPPGNGVEMRSLGDNPKKPKTGEFRYFSTSVSSRSPSSSTDMTSSLGSSHDGTMVSNNNVKTGNPKKPSSTKSAKDAPSNDADVPSAHSAFSVVKSKQPSTRRNGGGVKSPKRAFHRIDDIGITYEEYSSGSESDEYENTTKSVDSISCELFPPLTPRHKHFLRRYDAMQVKYLENRKKYHTRKETFDSEKSEGFSPGNDVIDDGATKPIRDVTRGTPTSTKFGESSLSHAYLDRASKSKLLAQKSRKLYDAFRYESNTSSDSDSDSDWGNSAALQQCWERVAQMGQFPLLKAGPITFSHTRKDGIFV